MPIKLELMPGDVVLARSAGCAAGLIRAATRLPGESRTKVNHCGVMTSATAVIEAIDRTREHLLETQYGPPSESLIAIYRMRDLEWGARVAIARRAQRYRDAPYGWGKIAAHAVDRYLFLGRSVVRRGLWWDRYPICSWINGYAYYEELGYRFLGKRPSEQDPDDIWDDCQESRTWECVMELGSLEVVP